MQEGNPNLLAPDSRRCCLSESSGMGDPWGAGLAGTPLTRDRVGRGRPERLAVLFAEGQVSSWGASLWGRPGPQFPLTRVLRSAGYSGGGAAAVPRAGSLSPWPPRASGRDFGASLEADPAIGSDTVRGRQGSSGRGVSTHRQAGLAADARPAPPPKADQLLPGPQPNVGTRFSGKVAAGAPPWCPPPTSP